MRCLAQVGVEGAEGVRDRNECLKHLTRVWNSFSSRVTHRIFLTKAWQDLFYVCESERVYNEFKNQINLK